MASFVIGGVLAIAAVVLIVNQREKRVVNLPGPYAEPTPEISTTLIDSPGGERGRMVFSQVTTNQFQPDIKFRYWWEQVPDSVTNASLVTGVLSNTRKRDYAGPEACRECHQKNFENWSSHPHRWMNAMVGEGQVKGDFSSNREIHYLGGVGKFYRQNGEFRMSTERNGKRWVYQIRRTIGSRFFQYYVGRLIEGESPDQEAQRRVDHVLPFGYWIDKKEWVPTVHVEKLEDKDQVPGDPYDNYQFSPYDRLCSECHTTLPAGDWLVRQGIIRGQKYSPRSVSFDLQGYLKDKWGADNPTDLARLMPPDQSIATLMSEFSFMKAETNAVSLGITCEACHLGCRQHVEQSRVSSTSQLPPFFFAGPHVFSSGKESAEVLGRTRENVNFVCARCHSGERTEYAGGMHTWNSTEYSDAINGHCYSPALAVEHSMEPMTCVHCHDPHLATGKKWTPSPRQDDQKCITCHQQFKVTEALTMHTRHSVESGGSRCMNCHMPKINEGMQDMVRTHRIFSPTDKAMIESNQPNACNLCHLDKPIDWTIGKLREWYGEKHDYSDAALTRHYPNRKGSVGVGWLKGPHAPTRLAAASAVTVADVRWVLPELIDLLSADPYLINRQFTQKRIEEMLGIDLRDHGYRFYMMPEERREVIEKIRPELTKMGAALSDGSR